MSDEKDTQKQDGNNVAKDEKAETEKNEVQKEPKSVSFNRDVHVKRFGKPRESRSTSSEHQPPIRKEPFTHLSEQELIEEANRVRAQAESVTCTADHPPEKFFSLPHRRKFKEQVERRNSDDATTEEKKPLGRSTSDVSTKRKKERTSLSTLFRKAQRTKSPDVPVVVATKPVTVVKRSKSDVSDLKSNTSLSTQSKPIRKRSGSETEEFLKSLRNKKIQLSPIIESSPREDYFKKTPPLEEFQKNKLTKQDSNKSSEKTPPKGSKINPVEKPPRYKSPDKEPKPPIRSKKGKSTEKELSPSIKETPKRKTEVKKTLLVDEIDTVRGKEINPVEIKERIKDSIKKIEENIYGSKDMIHSSQQPPDKPPLTRGHTVGHIVRILKEDQMSPPTKTHIIASQNGTHVNQPFSYTKPSRSPDPNLFVRNTSPDRVPTPVNKMTDKGVVYAQVVRENGENGSNNVGKQTIHKTYSPSREKYRNLSDEDEGLGYEDRYKIIPKSKNDYSYKPREDNNFKSLEGYKVTDSPIRPRFREYKLTSFDDVEPTYANEYPTKEDRFREYTDTTFRGRADGMDNKRKQYVEPDTKIDLDFNELSHRRQLLESRLKARRFERDRVITEEPAVRYLSEKDPIYEAEKRMKATEKYVNETARYYRQTLERDGFAESTVTEDYDKHDSENAKVKYNTESRTFQKVPKGELDRREFIDNLDETLFKEDKKSFPPEPEYEPPSLEFTSKPLLTPDEYTEKKYKVKTRQFTSSHDVLQTGQKYKKDDWFSKKKSHYASNPDINQGMEDDYANTRYVPTHPETYHNSLKREKNRDKYLKENYGIRRHDSGDSHDYSYRDERSPRRFDIDNRLVDSGIENDFRKDSSGEIHGSRYRRHESDDDVRDTSLFLASERQHTEDNYPSEQIYANGEYITRFENKPEYPRKEYIPRERNADDSSNFGPRIERYDRSPSRHDDKLSSKPPKANKKLSGLEKMKQLFSRDSSKKSKKEKEISQKPRTRVLKSPEHLVGDTGYRRYKDPEPSDEDRRKEYKEYRSSREDIDRYRSSDPRDSDPEKYREDYRNRTKERSYREDREEKFHREDRQERRRYESSDRDSDHRSPRPSDVESEIKRDHFRKTRSKTADPLDSPALAQRYRERRRLATPSPTPSPPYREPVAPPPTSTGNWFKSLDRLTRKKNKVVKNLKENGANTEDESTTRKSWAKTTKPQNSPAKNLRFFGDTDQDSDANTKHSAVTKSKSHPQGRSHTLLRKTTSNSSTGLDEVDRSVLTNKSSSLSNLHREEKEDRRYYKRNLHNISENHSNSETESNFGRKVAMKPPISPYERRSRSHSSSKTLKGSKADVRRQGSELRGSSSELRGSKQELSRDLKHRRRTPGNNSGESSTEGDSSHQSQRSVVYLHATTVGDIPDPGVLGRNRSRDDVSSVNSSNLQIRTTQKSFSIFAPWTPKHHNDQYDVHYAQKTRKPKPKENLKNPTSTKPITDDRQSTLQKKKSYSQTTLNRRPPSNRISSSNTTLYRKPEKRSGKENDSLQSKTLTRSKNKKSQSSEVLNRENERERISRSISMPKDKNKKAGWFNLSNKNKKQEINTRVR